MQKKTLTNIDFQRKKVLIRVDFNVPLDSHAHINDDTRIRAALPTIQYILDHGGSVILMSHLGRPKGKKVPSLSLAPCAERLSQLLNHPVKMASDCIGPDVKKLADALHPGEILLLENLRFHSAEEHPEEDPNFAQQLASLASVYVNDAFGTAHRSHASTVTITRHFPENAVAGLLLQKEIEILGNALQNPKRPFYAIMGGAKISTKLGVIRSLMKQADGIFIGGAMSFTLLKAQGYPIGDSLYEASLLDETKEILAQSQEGETSLNLPIDHVIANRLAANAKTAFVEGGAGIPDGWMGVDIGPQTIELYVNQLKKGATVLWNGPLGVFEIPPFDKGTRALAQALAGLSATTIVGGGDSIAAVQQAGVSDQITHLSTGGGASLKYIEYGTLPAIEALSDCTLSSFA